MLERWRRAPLSVRLAWWYGICGSVLLAAFSGVLYTYVAGRMARPLDEVLRGQAAEIRARVTIDAAGRARWDGRPLEARGAPWFELWDERGRLVARHWEVDEATLERLTLAPAAGRESIAVFFLSPELRLRALTLPFDPGGGRPAWMLRVMHEHEPAAEALGALRVIIATALPVVILLLVGGGWWITRRWIGPLHGMVAEAERIDARDLGRRLPVENPPDELGRLATAFNVTLGRLEDSFTALDRFVADAAHELRTPLTTLRSVGELALERARTPEEYRETIGSMLEEAQRLHRLVEHLLELARAEGGALAVAGQPVALDELAAAVVEDFRVLAEQEEQQLELATTPGKAWADPVLVQQALLNLVDNAMKYSPRGTIVRVEVSVGTDEARLAVSDEGPGIAPEHRARLTERFYRVETGAGGRRGGLGLGLALTKAYLRVLGGRLDYEPREPRGSRFVLVLPVRPPGPVGRR
jgi:heavy metal sensor kinase